MSPVEGAAYNSNTRSTGVSPCLHGTRDAVLQEIEKWVESDSASLFWLYGLAGSGKSTIANTIAQRWSQASFFFSRRQLSLRGSRFFFQTIAFQLGSDHPIFKEEISNALKDRSLLNADRATQLKKLILDPISKVQARFRRPLVIVVDALDECEEDAAVIEIIELLATTLNSFCSSAQLRFLVTSRPEPYLLELFKRLQIPSFDLSGIDSTADISVFVRDELQKLVDQHTGWPEEQDIQFLVDISNGVFIAAHIAVNFLALDNNSPPTQLQKLRAAGEPYGLDTVYKVVLDAAISDMLLEKQLTFKTIIGTLILSSAPLSLQAISNLL